MSYCTNLFIPEEANLKLPAEVRVGVTGEAAQGSWSYSGHAEVVYQLEQRLTSDIGLVATRSGVQLTKSLDAGNMSAILDSVRKQQQGLITTEVEYDLRSLFYCLGELAARTMQGIAWPTQTAERKNFEPYITSVRRDSLLVAPVGGTSSEVLYTISVAAAMAGCDHFYIVASQNAVPSRPSTLVAKRRYIHLTMRHLIADITGMNVYGDHMVAFARGMMNRVTVRAHSDEGGWVRAAMRKATYPVVRGLIDTQSGEYFVSERFAGMETSPASFASNCYGVLLQLCACVADSDPHGKHGMCTVLHNDAYRDEMGVMLDSPSGVAGLPSNFPELGGVCSEIESHAVRVFNSSDINVATTEPHLGLPRGTFRGYFSDNLVDAHLARPTIIPYLFVENGPLLRGPNTVPQPGPRAGRTVELEPLPGATVVPGQFSPSVLRSGRHSAGMVITPYQHCGLRSIGLYYLASAAFNGGVSHMGNVEVRTVEPVDEVMAFSRAGGTTLESKAWIRPQCPIPAAGECHVGGGRVVLVTHSDPHSKFLTGLESKVSVTCSTPFWSKVEKLGAEESVMRRNLTWDLRSYLPDSEFTMRENMINAALTSLVRTSTPPNLVGATATAADAAKEREAPDEPIPDVRSQQAANPPPTAVGFAVETPPSVTGLSPSDIPAASGEEPGDHG